MRFNPKVSRSGLQATTVTLLTPDEIFVGLYMRDLTADGEHVTVTSATGRVLFVSMSHQQYIDHTNEVNRLKNELADAKR